jgi:hypothetical protein
MGAFMTRLARTVLTIVSTSTFLMVILMLIFRSDLINQTYTPTRSCTSMGNVNVRDHYLARNNDTNKERVFVWYWH